jgi:hypothetical protein
MATDEGPADGASPQKPSRRKPRRQAGGPQDTKDAAGEVTGTPPGASSRGGGAAAHNGPEPEAAAGADAEAARPRVRRRSGLKPEDKKQLTEVVRTGRKRDRAKQKAREAQIAAAGVVDPEPTAGQPAWQPSEEELGQIQAMAGLGFSIEETCIVLGISEETWYTYADTLRLKQQRVQGLVLARTNVRQALYDGAVAGSIGHIRLYLELIEGYVARTATEVTGKGGGPVEQHTTGAVAVSGPLPDAEIMARLRTLADRAASVVSTTLVHAQPAPGEANPADADSADADPPIPPDTAATA